MIGNNFIKLEDCLGDHTWESVRRCWDRTLCAIAIACSKIRIAHTCSATRECDHAGCKIGMFQFKTGYSNPNPQEKKDRLHSSKQALAAMQLKGNHLHIWMRSNQALRGTLVPS